VQWKGKPILIRRRTPVEIAIARSISVASLIDPVARVAGLGDKDAAIDDNRTKAGHGEWLVVAGACTRCSCLLKDGRVLGLDDIAFFCACCASRFDLPGRVRGRPAPMNLAVPSYRFTAPTRLEISL
jgi:ubiquinol-cytochrome c reductase iron-sulfur subunit